MAKLADTALELPEPDYRNFNPETDPEEVAFKKLLDASDALPDHLMKGRVLRWQRGDGYAYYLVTKERPLTLQWIRYADAWQVEDALIKGLDLNDVREQVRGRAAIRAAFTKEV